MALDVVRKRLMMTLEGRILLDEHYPAYDQERTGKEAIKANTLCKFVVVYSVLIYIQPWKLHLFGELGTWK